jgi:hypothetical protein
MIPTLAGGPSVVAARISRCNERYPREAANLSRVGLGDTSTVTAGRAPRAGWRAYAAKLLTLSLMLGALTATGCARQLQPQAVAVAHAPSAVQTCRAEPPPAPDCEFRESELKTVDPQQFARLKAAYQRRCYQRAEKAARERQRWLRASKGC